MPRLRGLPQGRARNHPDVVLALPEAERVARKLLSRGDLDKAPSRDLRVADIRALEHRIRLPATEGRHKVILVVPADRMNPAAQNALLKTLEEPPAATTLILVTAAEGALLPTIRSRCARVVFAPLPVELVASEVASRTGVDAGTARVVATLAGGSLGAALALDPETVAARQALVAAVRALDPADGLSLTGFADAFAPDRDTADRNLGLVALWYRDVLAVQAGADPQLLANADLEAEARADAERHGPRALLGRLAAVDTARRDLVRNVNPRLALEAMVARFP